MSAPEAIEFRVLGPLEVRADGDLLPLGSPKQRALLALLLLHANEPLSRDRLIDELWGEAAPASVNSALHVYLSRLRKQVGDQLVRDGDGYHLRIEPDRLDATRFVELARRGREALAAGQTAHAAERARRRAGPVARPGPVRACRAGRPCRGRTARRAPARRLRGSVRGGAGARPRPRADGRAPDAGRRAPLPRASLRPAHPGALPLGQAGRGAAGLPARPARPSTPTSGSSRARELRELEQAILRQDEGLTGPELGARPGSRGTRLAGTAAPGDAAAAVAALGCWRAGGGGGVAAIVLPLAGRRPGSPPPGPRSTRSGCSRRPTAARTGQIPVQASPSAVTSGAGSIWVANVDAHSVSRIDPIRTGHDPDDPGRQRPGRHRVRRRLRLGHERPRRHGLEDRPADEHGGRSRSPVGNGPAGVAVGARLRVGRELERRHRHADRPAHGHAAHGRSRSARAPTASRSASARSGSRASSTGSVTPDRPALDAGRRVDPGRQRRGRRRHRRRRGLGRQRLDGTVTRIDPATNARSRHDPGRRRPERHRGRGRRGLGEQRARRHALEDRPRAQRGRPDACATGERPKGVALDSGALFVAVRASGAGHRGGTLTVLAPQLRASTRLDPALRADRASRLTNDGLTGFRRVGGSAGTRLVPDLAVSLPTPTDGGRSYTFQLRPGIRYSTGALVRPQDIRRAIERSLGLNPGLAVFYGRIVGAQRCVRAPRKPCDLSAGIVTDAGSNTVTFHLTRSRPQLPVRAGPLPGLRRAGGDASSARGRARPGDRPVRDRLLLPHARRSGSSATRGFASGRRRPSRAASRTSSWNASAARPTRTWRRSSHGTADLATDDRSGLAGRARLAPDTACRASSSSTRGTPPTRSRSTPGFRRSTTCGSAGR